MSGRSRLAILRLMATVRRPAFGAAHSLALVLAGRALLVFLAVFTLYGGTALLLGRTSSPPYAYFPEQAEAFLAGRLWIDPLPWTMDLTFANGHWYLPFPPLPALLLLPWVAVAGATGVNTVLFSCMLGAAAATVLFLILEQAARLGWVALPGDNRLLLVALLAMGSVQWQVALSGAVWHLGQEAGLVAVLLAVLLALTGRGPLLVGGALALAMLARSHLALTWPLLMGIVAQRWRDAGLSWPVVGWRLVGWTALAGVPLALAAGGLLSYNWARFGSPLDFGYTRQVLYDYHALKLMTWGWFSLHYLPENLHALLLALPRWEHGALRPDWNGMSVLLTTPALVLLPCARRPRLLVVAAWLAIVLLLVPLMTYYNTGYKQFGYRFSLDLMPAALLLLALASGRQLAGWVVALIGVGIVVNAWGVLAVYAR
ncbi:MAG: hypothetical protein K6U89_11830 [Chloroflexi bacterium]|nr:hypothetical protein [Chloroflexota bacterium]